MAENPNTELTMLGKLSADESYKVRLAVTRRPDISADTFDRLLQDPNIKHAALYSAKTPKAHLQRYLTLDQDTQALRWLACNPNISVSFAKTLANHEDDQVRLHVAQNAITSPDILNDLAMDESSDIREAVARNTNTATRTLLALVDDAVPKVRLGLLINKQTPEDVIQLLAADKDKTVQKQWINLMLRS